MAKRKRRPWEAEHIQILKNRAKKRVRARSIAKALRRTEGAVRQKAFALGLSLDTRQAA